MSWKQSALLTLLAVGATGQLVAQTSSAQPATASAVAVDPTGKFDVEVVLSSGQAGTGRLVIRGTPGKYEGTLAADGGQGPLEIKSVTFAQDTVLVSVAPPGAPEGITLHLNFGGTGFVGHFEGVESGKIKGTKIG